MILFLADVKSYGKMILYRFPHSVSLLKEKLSLSELIDRINCSYQYCTDCCKYSCQVIKTCLGFLSEQIVVDMFSAKQKYTQVVMGIDDDCIIISKSAFMHNFNYPILQNTQCQNNFSQLITTVQKNSSIINSISILYCQSDYQCLEDIKHKLSYILGLIELKQMQQQYLSKQVQLIMESKEILNKQIKEIINRHIKDQNLFEELKIKRIREDVIYKCEETIQQINLFHLIHKFYDSIHSGDQFNGENLWPNAISSRLKIPDINDVPIKQLENKTLVTLPPKLNDSLPDFFYSEKLKRLYETILQYNNKPLKKEIQTQFQINQSSVYYSTWFLLQNNIGVTIYPLDTSHYYSLFTIYQAPSKQFIDKFNRIFIGSNLLEYIQQYSSYKHITHEDQKLKYLLMKGILKPVKIYIYKCETKDEDKVKNIDEKNIEKVLEREHRNQTEINEIISRYTDIKMKALVKFVTKHFNQWRFYFVE